MTHLPKLPNQEKLQPCVMHVVRVSGTIRKAEEEVIRRAREAILRARRESGGSGNLDAILGSADRRMVGKKSKTGYELEGGIEDEDEEDDDDDDEDGDQDDMDHNG